VGSTVGFSGAGVNMKGFRLCCAPREELLSFRARRTVWETIPGTDVLLLGHCRHIFFCNTRS
jgi:hypothetical protein